MRSKLNEKLRNPYEVIARIFEPNAEVVTPRGAQIPIKEYLERRQKAMEEGTIDIAIKVFRTCVKCGEHKEGIYFSNKYDTLCGLNTMCKECHKTYLKELEERKKLKEEEQQVFKLEPVTNEIDYIKEILELPIDAAQKVELIEKLKNK